MCRPHNVNCFSEKEKEILRKKGWNEEEIKFVNHSIVEERIRELIK